ncbi:type II toxin-antitoxin system Phd/YefM family antitoxin [Limosilactobacillus mucosae]|uniref:type II toxin-antitoxin system Phd/YefM family antitoxin n=1 Tax=Limosilactobacillus mucosae TaxID=97478 RepID=UPI00233E7989|nr:type II toxin-antitoxin system Phd/YefM family antitoxin [Limosilactobacillus mucosae]MDC2842267.1 type II toxin-antitoxin system Phd/YefM family antitoxin [Limosilactobacillus mucosae]
MLKNDVPTSDINVLKDSTSSVFEQAAKAQTGVYILDHNVPCGVVMSVDDYEKIFSENDRLLDEITELKAAIRLNNSAPELVSDYQVRGEKALREPVIDKGDGWE